MSEGSPMITQRGSAVRWFATLPLAALVLAVPGVTGATGATGIVAAQERTGPGAQHRGVTRPGVPESTRGRRMVANPSDIRARAAAAPAGSTSYSYTSAAGDYIGQGRSRTFTAPADTVSVRGD